MDYYLKIEHADQYAPQYAFKFDPNLQHSDGFGLTYEWDYDLSQKSDAEWMQSILFSERELGQAINQTRRILDDWDYSDAGFCITPVQWHEGVLEGQESSLVRLLPLSNVWVSLDEPKNEKIIFGWLSGRPDLLLQQTDAIFARVRPNEGPELYRVRLSASIWGWDGVDFDAVVWREEQFDYLLKFPWYEPAYPIPGYEGVHVAALSLLTANEAAAFEASVRSRPMVRNLRVERVMPADCISRYPFCDLLTHDSQEGLIVPPPSWIQDAGFPFKLGYRLDY